MNARASPSASHGAPLRWRRAGELVPLGRVARIRFTAARAASLLVAAALSPLLLVLALVSKRAASAVTSAILWPVLERWEAVTREGEVALTIEVLPFVRWQALPSTRASTSARATLPPPSSTASG